MDTFLVSELPQARGLHVAGELDLASSERLRTSLVEAVMAGGPLFVDMRELTFQDSAGIHAWVDAAEALRPEGWCLTLHAPTAPVQRMMEICDLDRVDNIHVIYHDEPGEIADLPVQGL
jgi:anti-anti-sigma factor